MHALTIARRIIVALLFATTLAPLASRAQINVAGAGGEPDRDFGAFAANGQAGVYRFAINTMTAAYALGVQSSGKPIIAGFCGANPIEDICVARLQIDGTQLDSSFTGGGLTTLTIAGQDFVRAMAIDAQDRIYVTGYCNGLALRACVHRFTANGALDTSFGTGGRSGFSGMLEALAIKIDSNGNTVGVGECFASGSSRMCAARLTESGAMDASFNNGAAFSLLPSPANSAIATDLVIDSSERILITGYCSVPTANGARYRFCAARLTASGALDRTFGIGGARSWAVINADDRAESWQIALTPDGGILVAGICTAQSDSIPKLCTSKLTANGNFDLTYGYGSFAGQSIQVVPGALSPTSSRLMIDALGRATITTRCNALGAFCFVRLLATGQPDPTYGSNGLRTYQPESGANGTPNFSQVSQLLNGNRWLTVGDCARTDNSGLRRACVTRHYLDQPPGERCSLDLDGDGFINAATDGLLWARWMIGFRGASLIANAVATDGTRKTAAAITSHVVSQCDLR